ncbi:MAG: hypothetical protein HKL85_08875 [Acidimicrobiaceae bacterium]|nr:hypothetical protein [Acidimicrobiaceae bacterium]
MRIRKLAAAAMTVVVVSFGGVTVASASANATSVRSVQVGDWATYGCISAPWEGTTYINAWALDNVTSTVHFNQGFATEGGTFTAYCDPNTGTGFIGATSPIANGAFHGKMDPTGANMWGNLTYYGTNGWVFTEQWNFNTTMAEFGVPANTPYTQTENFTL